MTLGSTTGRKKGRSSGSSSSRHVHHLSVARSSSGVASVRRETLTASSIQRQQQRERREYQELHGMTPAQKHELDAVQRNLAANLPNEDSAEGWEMDMQDVMSGEAVLDISHAGGEFADLVDDPDTVIYPTKRQVLVVYFSICSTYMGVPDVVVVTTEHDVIEQSAEHRHLQHRCPP